MKARFIVLLGLLVVFGLAACSGGSAPSLPFTTNATHVSIVYGSEKQAWLDPLIKQYNAAAHKTKSGNQIVVDATPIGSIDAITQIIGGQIQPTVWSPASSVYNDVANSEWRKTHSDNLIPDSPKDLVLSPVVIAMWKPMAEALGYPQKAIGWADIAGLATSGKGWDAYGYPEFGAFQFGHTHPNYSNSGIVSLIAEAYAGAGKTRGLTVQDLDDPKVRDFVANVESAVIHYGTSTGFFATRMFQRGPSYVSAAVMYESLIANQETARLAGQSSQPPVVAIYPKEGTIWSNHPYIVLNAPWVTADQKEAALAFQDFLLDKPQQLAALQLGFRPSDPSIPLGAPLDATHGVDPTQPKTILENPSPAVIQKIVDLWTQVKKPVDLVVAVDVSGSMAGDKIAQARTSLSQFIQKLDDRDRLAVMLFNDKITLMSDLSPVKDKRDDLSRRVSGIVEGGDTRLYDATLQAYDLLKSKGDPKHIRAIVVLSDGADTVSSASLDDVVSKLGNLTEGGSSTKVFTIAYGSDADNDILKKMAESTGAAEYDAKPSTIDTIYGEIATFF